MENPAKFNHAEDVTRPRLDVQALHDALDQQRRTKKLSWRQVAGEAGVSPSTLSRMTQGKRPDVDSFAALVNWLGAPAGAFLRGPAGEAIASRGEMLAVLSTHLREDKNISPKTVDALKDLLGAVERLMDSRAEPASEDEGDATAPASRRPSPRPPHDPITGGPSSDNECCAPDPFGDPRKRCRLPRG